MPSFLNVADTKPDLATALGRFAEGCCHLERNLEAALFRLLPVTDNIGRVLLSGNQLRRNTDILRALATLPDVPLQSEQRPQIETLATRISAVNDNRTRLLHSPIVEGDNGILMIVQHKQNGVGSSAMPITVPEINAFTDEANAASYALIMTIQSLTYDLSQWTKAWPEYPKRPYPKKPAPGNLHLACWYVNRTAPHSSLQ